MRGFYGISIPPAVCIFARMPSLLWMRLNVKRYQHSFSVHFKAALEIRKVFEYRNGGMIKMLIKRGDVFYADLDPIIGSEQGGIRPVLVVQNNVGNKYSPTVVVPRLFRQPKKNNMPTHIHICGSKMLPKDSIVLAEQIRTIDRNRLLRYVGSVSLEIMGESGQGGKNKHRGED